VEGRTEGGGAVRRILEPVMDDRGRTEGCAA
jgi:hypothetical protein